MQKGVSLFLSYTNMNKMNSLHHVKEHPKISNFLQFESHSSKCFNVRAIRVLRDLYENKVQGLTSLAFMFYISNSSYKPPTCIHKAGYFVEFRILSSRNTKCTLYNCKKLKYICSFFIKSTPTLGIVIKKSPMMLRLLSIN